MIKRLLTIVAFGISSLFISTQGASAAYNCPFTGANLNNSIVCADANFLTGQGRIEVKGSAITDGQFYKLEVQTKIGTLPWATRCEVMFNKAPTYCSGTSGFATPPPNTNTQVRVKFYFTTTSYGYYSVPVTQV